ncbi:general substrate transporter [Penicillium herquei]|nr:general substrate transporter [Penicillium herquei]
MNQKQSPEAKHIESAPTMPPTSEKALVRDAWESSAVEHNLTVYQAINAYPMAIFWCLVVSMCVIMEGYSQILVQSLYAYPQFQKYFGSIIGYEASGAPVYQLTAAWQAGLTNASTVGGFFGTILNGYVVDWFGHRKVLFWALIVEVGFTFITFFASDITVLCVGQILMGVPWGIFATSAPAYASEILPMVLRIYFTSFTNMCFCTGQLIAAGVLRALANRPDEWSYRIPFAIQWVWPAFLIPAIFFAPPSPWYEVQKGRLDSAKKSLMRLQRKSAAIDSNKTLAMIVSTNQLEEEISAGTSYWDCFKSFERRRTEIACLAFCGQVLSGSNFAYNSSYFFEQLGLNTSTVYSLNLGGLGLALGGTIISWILCMPYFGRRTLYLWGMFTMTLLLFIIGILNIWTTRPTVGYTQAALAMFWNLIFDMTVGQLGWSIPAEIGSTRLRQKTICLARNAYYLMNIVAGVLQQYFMNPTAWNLSGYTGFFWAGTAAIVYVWAFFRLPETKNRTYEELDILFSRKTPARAFKKANIDEIQNTSGSIP